MSLEFEINEILSENMHRLTKATMIEFFDEISSLIQREIIRDIKITFEELESATLKAKEKMIECIENRLSSDN